MPKDHRTPLAQAIRAAREARGWSQQELGDRLGFTQSRVSKIERGALDLRVSTLMAVARALDLEVVLLPQSLRPLFDRLGEQRADARPRRRYELDDDG